MLHWYDDGGGDDDDDGGYDDNDKDDDVNFSFDRFLKGTTGMFTTYDDGDYDDDGDWKSVQSGMIIVLVVIFLISLHSSLFLNLSHLISYTFVYCTLWLLDQYKNSTIQGQDVIPSITDAADKFLLSDFNYDYFNGAMFRKDTYDRARREKPANKFHPEGNCVCLRFSPFRVS